MTTTNNLQLVDTTAHTSNAFFPVFADSKQLVHNNFLQIHHDTMSNSFQPLPSRMAGSLSFSADLSDSRGASSSVSPLCDSCRRLPALPDGFLCDPCFTANLSRDLYQDFASSEPLGPETSPKELLEAEKTILFSSGKKTLFRIRGFDNSGWSPSKFTSWSNSLLLQELRRPSPDDPLRLSPYLDELMYEIYCRTGKSDFLSQAGRIYAASRRESDTGEIPKSRQSSGSRRAATRSKQAVFNPRPPTRRSYVENPYVAPDRSSSFLSDYIYGFQPLFIGTIPVSTREEMISLDISEIFHRHRPFFLEMLSSSVPLSSYQQRVTQKLMSDGNFRHRIERYILARESKAVDSSCQDSSFPQLTPMPPHRVSEHFPHAVFLDVREAVPATPPSSPSEPPLPGTPELTEADRSLLTPRFQSGAISFNGSMTLYQVQHRALDMYWRNRTLDTVPYWVYDVLYHPRQELLFYPVFILGYLFGMYFVLFVHFIWVRCRPRFRFQSGLLEGEDSDDDDLRLPIPSVLPNLHDSAVMAEQMFALSVTVRQVYLAELVADKLAVLYLYVRGLPLKDLYNCVLAHTVDYESHFQSPAYDFAENLLALLGISNIFACFMIPTTGFDFVYGRFRELAKRSSGDDLLVGFWRSFRQLLSCFSECFKSGSLDPLFADGASPKDILFAGEALIAYKNEIMVQSRSYPGTKYDLLVSSGKIPRYWNGPFLHAEYVQQVETTISSIDCVFPLLALGDRPPFNALRGRLTSMLTSMINAKSVNGTRIQPYAFVLTGEPGAGKSNLIGQIVSTVARRNGFCDDPTGVYNWQQGVNFQDGANSTQWVFVADDIDHNCKMVAPGVQNHVDAIMTICDNKPFPIESANVNEKGNNYASPLMFIYATNFPGMRLVGFSPEPKAIFRRLPTKLHVRALPQYTTNGIIDGAKVDGAIDIHEIDIWEFDHKLGDYVLKDYNKALSTSKALLYLCDGFARNLRSQNNLLNRSAIKYCETCSLPAAKGSSTCGNCSGHLQGGAPSTMIGDASEAAASARRIVTGFEEKRIVERIDSTMSRVEEVVNAPRRAVKTVVGAASTLGDFVKGHFHYAAAATGLIGLLFMLQLTGGTLQGRVNNSMQTAPIDFVKVSDVKPTSGEQFKHVTHTKEELLTRIRANLGIVKSKNQFVHCLRVGLDAFVTTRHSIDGDFVMEYRGVSYLVSPQKAAVSAGSKDILLFHVPGVPAQPHCLNMFWEDVDTSYTTFDDVFLVSTEGAMPSTMNVIYNENIQGYSGLGVRYDIKTKDGDCGLPLVAKVGQAYRIVGLHHLIYDGVTSFFSKGNTAAVVLTRSELRLMMSRVCATHQSASIVMSCFPNGFAPHELGSETKSELALAMQRGAEVVTLGHLPKSRCFSSSKSKCTPSILYKDVAPRIKEITGVEHYWQIPVLKGKMIDGHWESGYQKIFPGYMNLYSVDGLYGPVQDYLEGMENLDVTGFAPLSLDECILGVESSVISGVNMATSVGPPLGGPKNKHFSLAGSVSPPVNAQLMEIISKIESGCIPLVPSDLSFKDEPVKYSKQATADIRVINCLPAAFNLVVKQYMAPIKAFMRYNPMYFESMVGIDMTKDGGQRICDRFRLINPDLDNVVEGDFRKMDKMINGSMYWGIVEVFKRIATILGMDPEIVATLVWAQANVIYSIQGDLFQIGGSNPSGSDITVEINAVANSLSQRAAWYDLHGRKFSRDDYLARRVPSKLFRDEVSLVTFGDDFLAAHARRVALADLMAKFVRYGMYVTDGAKLDVPIYRHLFQCSFLKRGFSGPLNDIRCGLDVKSILRMLAINKPSKLGAKEQAAVCCEEAIREVFLNRSLNFAEWRTWLVQLADQHNLWDSRYLSLHPFDTYEEMYQNKTFTTWSIPPVGETWEGVNAPDAFLTPEGVVVAGATYHFQSKMSQQIQFTPAVGEVPSSTTQVAALSNLPVLASNQATPTDTTYGSMVAGGNPNAELTHASGNIVSLTNPVVAGSTGITRVDQAMSNTMFGDFLHRNVLLATYRDMSTDGALLTPLIPWKTWAEHATITPKLRNFNFIRGSFIVSGKFIAPPLSSGLIVVTFLPTYEGNNTAPVTLQDCLILPHVVIDCSTSSDFEMTLPWIVTSNWGNLTDNVYEGYWQMYTRVLTGAKTSIPDGCATTCLQIYGRPGDDFQLSGAQFQSGRLKSAPHAATQRKSFNAAKPTVKASGGAVAKIQDVQQSVNTTMKETVGMKGSEFLSGVSKFTAMGAGIPVIGGALAGISAASKFAGTIADWFGFTRETAVAQVTDSRVRTTGNLMHADGQDFSDVSSIFSSNRLSIDPAINGALSEVDESSLAFIGGRFSHIGTLEYTVGATGFQDAFIPVTPCLGAFDVGGAFSPTCLGYQAARFTYWRGDMKYLFYPVLSPIHRGSLQFIWQPIPTDTAVTSDLTNVSVNSIVDVGAAQPIEVSIGYNNDMPLCFTDFYTLDTPMSEDDYFTLNGYLRVRAIVPFTGSVCGEVIQIHVFAACGENMQLALPTDQAVIEGEIRTWGEDLFPVAHYQSGTVGADGQQLIAVQLVPSSGDYPIDELLVGEKILSLRALMQKPSMVFWGVPELPYHDSGPRLHIPHSPQWTLGPDIDYLSYFGSQFLSFAGGIRYKMQIIRAQSNGGVSSYHLTPGICNAMTAGFAMPTSQINPSMNDDMLGVESLVPYAHSELWVPSETVLVYDALVWDAEMDQADRWTSFRMYRSAGPDMRLTFYRGPGSFLLTPTPNEYWTEVAVGNTPLGRMAARSAVRRDSKITLEQYRARTGRTAFKTPKGSLKSGS